MGRGEELVAIEHVHMDAGVRQPPVSRVGLGAKRRQYGRRFRSVDRIGLRDRRDAEHRSICQFLTATASRLSAGIAGEHRDFVFRLSVAAACRFDHHVDRVRDWRRNRAAIQMVRLRRQHVEDGGALVDE